MRTKLRTTTAIAATLLASTAFLTACSPASDTASKNISTAADNFEVQRRIVFFNGITDKYLLTIEGRCSINPDTAAKKLDVTCKIADNQYKKDFLGLSDNVSYFVEQMAPIDASVYHTRVIFKPESIVPDINVDMGKQ